jgi:TetR/AcrR family transcriptional regulator, transcriptional repressor for nem operon
VNLRQESAVRTRQALVDAGLRLAERTGLAGMSINLLVEEAGVSKGTFFHHFRDRAGFLLAVHAGFHDDLFADIEREVGPMPPGRERLLGQAKAYLDGCLRHRGVRALLLEARAEPLIADAVLDRNEALTELLAADFAAMDWPHPAESGRLWIALVVEAALIELRLGQRSPSARAALQHYIR